MHWPYHFYLFIPTHVWSNWTYIDIEFQELPWTTYKSQNTLQMQPITLLSKSTTIKCTNYNDNPNSEGGKFTTTSNCRLYTKMTVACACPQTAYGPLRSNYIEKERAQQGFLLDNRFVDSLQIAQCIVVMSHCEIGSFFYELISVWCIMLFKSIAWLSGTDIILQNILRN